MGRICCVLAMQVSHVGSVYSLVFGFFKESCKILD